MTLAVFVGWVERINPNNADKNDSHIHRHYTYEPFELDNLYPY